MTKSSCGGIERLEKDFRNWLLIVARGGFGGSGGRAMSSHTPGRIGAIDHLDEALARSIGRTDQWREVDGRCVAAWGD